jgi:hypothetical protein
MQTVVKNAKGKDTEPGCQAYYFFVPEDGNEDFLYGIEMYPPIEIYELTAAMMIKKPSKKPILTQTLSKLSSSTIFPPHSYL